MGRELKSRAFDAEGSMIVDEDVSAIYALSRLLSIGQTCAAVYGVDGKLRYATNTGQESKALMLLKEYFTEKISILSFVENMCFTFRNASDSNRHSFEHYFKGPSINIDIDFNKIPNGQFIKENIRTVQNSLNFIGNFNSARTEASTSLKTRFNQGALVKIFLKNGKLGKSKYQKLCKNLDSDNQMERSEAEKVLKRHEEVVKISNALCDIKKYIETCKEADEEVLGVISYQLRELTRYESNEIQAFSESMQGVIQDIKEYKASVEKYITASEHIRRNIHKLSKACEEQGINWDVDGRNAMYAFTQFHTDLIRIKRSQKIKDLIVDGVEFINYAPDGKIIVHAEQVVLLDMLDSIGRGKKVDYSNLVAITKKCCHDCTTVMEFWNVCFEKFKVIYAGNSGDEFPNVSRLKDFAELLAAKLKAIGWNEKAVYIESSIEEMQSSVLGDLGEYEGSIFNTTNVSPHSPLGVPDLNRVFEAYKVKGARAAFKMMKQEKIGNINDIFGNLTLLEMSIQSRDIEMFQRLLKSGADINLPLRGSTTAIDIIQNLKEEFLKDFITQSINDIKVNLQDVHGKNAIMYAVELKNLPLIGFLLSKKDIYFNVMDRYKKTVFNYFTDCRIDFEQIAEYVDPGSTSVLELQNLYLELDRVSEEVESDRAGLDIAPLP